MGFHLHCKQHCPSRNSKQLLNRTILINISLFRKCFSIKKQWLHLDQRNVGTQMLSLQWGEVWPLFAFEIYVGISVLTRQLSLLVRSILNFCVVKHWSLGLMFAQEKNDMEIGLTKLRRIEGLCPTQTRRLNGFLRPCNVNLLYWCLDMGAFLWR